MLYTNTRFKSGYIESMGTKELDRPKRQYEYTTDAILGKAYKNIKVMDGLSISLFNYCSDSGLKINYEIKKSPIVFNFNLSGESELLIYESGASPVHMNRRPGTSGVKFKTESNFRGTLKIPPKVYFSSIGIQIDECFLKDYIKEDAERLPNDFYDILYNEKSQQGGNRFFSGLTPSMMSAAASVLNYSVDCSINRLFLQSKATELICLKLFQLMAQKNKSVYEIKLSPQDKRNLFYAREMLVKDITMPPTIAELSKRAGINQLKLKKGFKLEFGTTILDYFNRYRMEKALEILKSGEKNISETAGHIGYVNVSHFIHSFKKRFGMTPGQAQKKIHAVKGIGQC